jgi:hypothetical protein
MMWYYLRNEIQTGPLSWEDLVGAARSGGVTPGDLVWTDGMAQWQPAASIPGLIPQVYPSMAGPRPGPPAAAPLGDDPVMRAILPVGRSGWAIAAGYLGLLSLLGIFGPPALICGILAIRDIKKHPEKHGLGRAWFGIILGALGTIALAVLVVTTLTSK